LNTGDQWNGESTSIINFAAIVGNDPAGSLLTWKGWSVHDRQSRFSDDLPLAPLPQIQPGMMFGAQDPYVEPFQEIDDEPGFYVNAEWLSIKTHHWGWVYYGITPTEIETQTLVTFRLRF
jgi:hypothetical protein